MLAYRRLTEDARRNLISELKWQHEHRPVVKDIVVVVRDQYNYVCKCLQSIRDNTKNYRLHIWDNGSKPLTRALIEAHDPHTYARADDNWGFVLPNNYLAAFTSAPYLVLLNSDTVVHSGWDEAMIGLLQANPDVGAVGYQGCSLTDDFVGGPGQAGPGCDYLAGWCVCIPREVYREHGLFDSNILLAYGEDSDFCLRLQRAGYKLYALHVNYVDHVGNVTVKSVNDEMDVAEAFGANHDYLKAKWGDHLAGRSLVY